VLSLIEPVIAQVLLDGLALKSRQGGKLEPVLILTSALLGTVGILFLLYAIYSGLLNYISPSNAALAAGVIALFFAALCALGAAKAARRRRRLQADQIPLMAADVQKSLAQIGRELEVPVRANPAAALLLAGLAGFMSGKRLH
jgi:hypothetical protein